jgi:L-phenylalanine/L-methionine N-acetyltransferase
MSADRPQPLIRAREPRDLDDLAAVFACPGVVAGTLWLPLRPLAAVSARAETADDLTHALVAEVEGRVVGTLGLHASSRPRRRHVGEIGMAVHDAWQGRGVGGALLAAALDLADDWLDLRRIELQVFADNAPAVRLYERFGFVVEGVAREFAFRRGAFVDALLMARLRDHPPAHAPGDPTR